MNPDLSEVVPDFDIAKDMKNTLMRLVEDDIFGRSELSPDTKTHDALTEDGRSMRLYFPTGLETLVKMTTNQSSIGTNVEAKDTGDSETDGCPTRSGWRCQRQLHFVVFVGYKKPNVQAEKLPMEIWEADNGLKNDMSSIPEILAYVSCERSRGGDWSNFVLFTAEAALEKWRASYLHEYLVKEFSPLFYSTVRIHRGLLKHGLFAPVFFLDRTLFLDYTEDEASEARDRHVVLWTQANNTSPVPWITVPSQLQSAEG